MTNYTWQNTRKVWILLIIAFTLLVGAAAADFEYDCIGQCARHTPRGKRCQDRCFEKGQCPNA